jgi:hypothetical protein
MEIQGSFNLNVGKVQIPSDSTNDGQQIWIDGEIKITPEQAEKSFGEAFHYVAFATMHDAVDPGNPQEEGEGDATVVRFGYDSKKAPKWLTPALHYVDLWGQKQKTQPSIQKIVAGDNERAVILKVRFVFDTNRDEALIGALGAKSGTTAKVKIKPVQVAAIKKAPAVVAA